jgi:hypothetical protein
MQHGFNSILSIELKHAVLVHENVLLADGRPFRSPLRTVISVTKGRTKLPKEFKIVETYWHDHSLESSWALFWGNNAFYGSLGGNNAFYGSFSKTSDVIVLNVDDFIQWESGDRVSVIEKMVKIIIKRKLLESLFVIFDRHMMRPNNYTNVSGWHYDTWSPLYLTQQFTSKLTTGGCFV